MTYGTPEHDRSPAQALTSATPSAAAGGQAPPAGWYPDPRDASRVRFWDGRDWTLDSYPAPAVRAAPVSPYSAGPSTFGAYADPAPISSGSISGGYTRGYVPGAASGLTPQPPRDAAHGPRRVGPIGAVTTAFSRVLDYGGRSSRSEYWWMALVWVLIEIVVVFAVASLTVSTAGATESGSTTQTTGVELVLYAVTLVVNLPLLVRRLHDTGRSGWWVLIGFIPFGGLVLLLFTVEGSQPGRNQYGPGPA